VWRSKKPFKGKDTEASTEDTGTGSGAGAGGVYGGDEQQWLTAMASAAAQKEPDSQRLTMIPSPFSKTVALVFVSNDNSCASITHNRDPGQLRD
jgi:hypothetical protein